MRIKNLFISVMLAAVTFTMTGCGTDKTAFSQYAVGVEEAEIPQEVQIVALGEATHGNAEFQELRLDVLGKLVEEGRVRSFALEGDFGGCCRVNEYIHGGTMTAKEAIEDIGFAIYCTDEMAELVEWMREYNETAQEQEQLNFYGFDMQRFEESVGIVTTYCGENGIECGGLSEIFDEKVGDGSQNSYDENVGMLNGLLEELSLKPEDEGALTAAQCVVCLKQNLELAQLDLTNPAAYSEYRDKFMSENIGWILQREKAQGNDCIMISGHNGHVAKQGNSYTNTGSLLADSYGDAYFVIGTDFYETECNLPTADGRENKSFCSKDPLAKMAKLAGIDKAYLDFDKAVQSEELAELVNQPVKQGSLGEFYAWYMKLLPQSYRIEQVPAALYDAMIFVPEATPTVIWEK